MGRSVVGSVGRSVGWSVGRLVGRSVEFSAVMVVDMTVQTLSASGCEEKR